MSEPRATTPLSEISTLWSVVLAAGEGPSEEKAAAREVLLERYGRSAHRYLRGVLRDPEAAEELYQEFALQLLRGDFKRAAPAGGRFRHYVKAALFHLVARYHRKQQAKPGPLPADLAAPSEPGPVGTASEEVFLQSWRKELLARAWDRLAGLEAQTGRPLYTVLRFRVEHPDMPGPQMAEQLAARLGKPMTHAATRQALHRARKKFSELLLHAVRQSLDNPTPDQVCQELSELGLLKYCRPALERSDQP
jgi:RNA polymerase sigma-70 factor (ECF subfamily)